MSIERIEGPVLPPLEWTEHTMYSSGDFIWLNQMDYMDCHYYRVELPSHIDGWMLLDQMYQEHVAAVIPLAHWVSAGSVFWFYSEEQACVFKLMVNI